MSEHRLLKYSHVILFYAFATLFPISTVLGKSPQPGTTGDLVQPRAYWVFLDRRDTSESARAQVLAGLSSKARDRRLRALGQEVVNGDLPPHPDDLYAIRQTGARIRTISRWLGAVSVETDSVTASRIARFPHVSRVKPVARGRVVRPQIPSRSKSGHSTADSAYYGGAWQQNQLIGVPLVHDEGITGEGVRIGFLDGGYNNYDVHIAFDSLRVVGTWNALDSTDNVETANHGSAVLSVVSADDPGSMVGVAPDVEVLLVRTEDSSDEYPAEEDYWVSGLQWAEARGADLISTSLGYYDWYTFEDMDGNTAVTTIAADLAAARGLLVVTSAGNRGEAGLGAPADGDSVLAVGAVDAMGEYVAFSSQGPTYDRRIKPDVAAMGYLVTVISDTTDSTYRLSNGTSFSCPAVAGALALLLQVDPNLTPMQMISLMRETASQADAPDTLLGWGVIDVYTALQRLRESTGTVYTPTRFRIDGPYPNPTNGAVRFSLELPRAGRMKVTLYNLLGQVVYQKEWTPSVGIRWISLPMEGMSSGIYLAAVQLENATYLGKVFLVR